MNRRLLLRQHWLLPTILLLVAFGIRIIAANDYWAWFDDQFPNTWEQSRLVPSQDGSQYVMQSNPNVWASKLYQGWRQKPYYRPPLASFYFAALLSFFNFDRVAISVIQTLLACCGYILLYLIVRRVFSRKTAILVLGLIAIHPILIFYDTSFEDSALAFSLLAAGCYALISPFLERSWYRYSIAGLLVGLASCARPNVLLVALLFALLLPRLVSARRLATVFAFVAPLVLCVAIPTFHNLRSDGQFNLITSTSGENFYWGNSGNPMQRISLQGFWYIREVDYASPTWLLLAELRRNNVRPEEPPRFAAAAWSNIKRRPGAALFEFANKAGRHLSIYEIPRNRNFEFLRESSLLFRFPLIPFALILGLTVIGLRNNQLRSPIRLTLLTPWVAVLITEIVFFNASRYRALSIPFLLPFAIEGGKALVEWVAARRLKSLVFALILLMTFLVIGVLIIDEKERERYLSASYFKAAILESYADADGKWQFLSEKRFSENLARALDLDQYNIDAFSLRQKYRIREGHIRRVLTEIDHRRRACDRDDWLCIRVCDALYGLAKTRLQVD